MIRPVRILLCLTLTASLVLAADQPSHRTRTPQFVNVHLRQISFIQPVQAHLSQWFEFTGDVETEGQPMFANVVVRNLASAVPQDLWVIHNMPVLPFLPVETVSQ